MSASEKLRARFEEIDEAEDIGVPVSELLAVVEVAEKYAEVIHMPLMDKVLAALDEALGE